MVVGAVEMVGGSVWNMRIGLVTNSPVGAGLVES